MINETPYIEVTFFKHDEYSYKAWVDGLNGRVEWDLFDEFRNGMVEEPYTAHPEIKPILARFDHERDGAITISANLVKVDLEVQHGTGEGEVLKLPAYYDLTNCAFINFERLTVERGGLVKPDGGDYPLKWISERGFKDSVSAE